MNKNIDLIWFRTYLKANKCRYDGTEGNTETWVIENKFAKFNSTFKAIDENIAKDVLQKFGLPITDFEEAWNNYNQHD
jgi:hypothetical protein